MNICTFLILRQCHRPNNRSDRGRLVPQLLGWGPTIYWSPNFLAIVFKKQEISQQSPECRIYHLSFQKIFLGWYPRTLTAGGGEPFPYPTSSPAFVRARGASAPVLGPKPWSPSTFQLWLRPWAVLTKKCTDELKHDLRGGCNTFPCCK